MLRERQRTILDAVVREYIRSARPVSSQELVRHFGMAVSPATVRNDMLELDDEGYLVQPHTSAGRIPTDKGYRFFVDNFLHTEEMRRRERSRLDLVFEVEEQVEFIRTLARTAARLAGSLAIAGIAEEDVVYQSGLSGVLAAPEFSDTERVRSFGRLIDELDAHRDEIFTASESESEEDAVIFIGTENPFAGAEGYAVMVSPWRHPAGFRGFLALVGPSRMDYGRNKSLLAFFNHYEL